MTTKKHLFVAVLAVFCLTFSLFSAVPTRSSSGDEQYDPWADTNDDGVINMRDIGAMCTMFGASGTPINKTQMILDLQNRVNALEERQSRLKTVRFYTPNETMSDQINVFKEAATFHWVPENATNNAILSIYCYFQYKGGSIYGLIPNVWEQNYPPSSDYAWICWTPNAIWRAPMPNQANYTLTLMFEEVDWTPVYIKGINIIIEVMDGLPPS